MTDIDVKETTKPKDTGTASAKMHPLLLIGILLGWAGSLFLHAYLTTGPFKVSALVMISVVWIVVFFLIGSATAHKRSSK